MLNTARSTVKKFKYLYCASVDLILLSTFAFLMHKQYKSPENDDFLMKICGFWIDFEADFKPSILKQDKGV